MASAVDGRGWVDAYKKWNPPFESRRTIKRIVDLILTIELRTSFITLVFATTEMTATYVLTGPEL